MGIVKLARFIFENLMWSGQIEIEIPIFFKAWYFLQNQIGTVQELREHSRITENRQLIQVLPYGLLSWPGYAQNLRITSAQKQNASSAQNVICFDH